uniref:Uncharacterized protein n=1 Tax=Candidatus Kentrum sp. LFY TaxID=2126342 RepID=A0A450U5X4_9GAMM|nr:MAG: hypothetical protein BECKLFY1418B_GA0070995_100446 [Candidatus Kentron sp. LFY]
MTVWRKHSRESNPPWGEGAADYLSPTETGLVEFGTFIDLIAGLEPSYWRLRDDRFDNDELDELLSGLRDDPEQLHALRDELKNTQPGKAGTKKGRIKYHNR